MIRVYTVCLHDESSLMLATRYIRRNLQTTHLYALFRSRQMVNMLYTALFHLLTYIANNMNPYQGAGFMLFATTTVTAGS